MVTTQLLLDKRRKSKNDTYFVRLRVYFGGKRKLYSTGIDLTEATFEHLFNRETDSEIKGALIEAFEEQKPKPSKQKLAEIKNKLFAFQVRANEVISKIDPFTFDAFERAYFTNRAIYSDVYTAFDTYIHNLESSGRIGTARSYTTALKSFQSFRKDLQFAEINKSLLQRYEKWMRDNGKSTTTIGIYIRSLRAVYNTQDITPTLYPFGERSNQYSIPQSRNIKKALKATEIAQIFNMELTGAKAKYRDYWMFLYLANGMNVVDMCNIKRSDIDGDKITFIREKTKNTTKGAMKTQVHIGPDLRSIINKYSNKSISKDAYLFPFFEPGMTDEERDKRRRTITRRINRYMNEIGKQLKIGMPLSTMVARHSFATTLKRAEVKTEVISEMMMHTSVATTKSYLDSFESDVIEKASSILTDALKAN